MAICQFSKLRDLKDTNDNYIQFFKYFKETSIIHEDNSMWSLWLPIKKETSTNNIKRKIWINLKK